MAVGAEAVDTDVTSGRDGQLLGQAFQAFGWAALQTVRVTVLKSPFKRRSRSARYRLRFSDLP